MYQISLRAFTPEGTLAAAARRLPSLADLGVDVLYLCPICLQDDDPRPEFWSPRQRQSPFRNPRNPYRIKDYFEIDPEYGDAASLRGFVSTAHRMGMRVILDVVFLHCGPGAVFLREHPGYVQRGGDGAASAGDWSFPLLDFTNRELREYLHANLSFWLAAFDLDGFRCDVSDRIPLDFWEEARDRLERIRPGVVIVGEGQRIDDQRHAMDLNYSVPWVFTIHKLFNLGAPAMQLRDMWQRMRDERPEGARFLRYIDNHDIAHDTSHGIARGPGQSEESWRNVVEFYGLPPDGLPPDGRIDKAWGTAAVDALLVLSFAMDGMPFIYNGQEIADTAIHSIYGRMPVDWSRGGTPAGRDRFALCRRLCAIRHAEAALQDGSLDWLEHDRPDEVLAFIRTSGPERCLVLVNVKPAAVQARLASPVGDGWHPLASAGMAAAPDGGFTIAPFGYLIARSG